MWKFKDNEMGKRLERPLYTLVFNIVKKKNRK